LKYVNQSGHRVLKSNTRGRPKVMRDGEFVRAFTDGLNFTAGAGRSIRFGVGDLVDHWWAQQTNLRRHLTNAEIWMMAAAQPVFDRLSDSPTKWREHRRAVIERVTAAIVDWSPRIVERLLREIPLAEPTDGWWRVIA